MTEGRKKDGMFCHLADGIQWKRKNFKREIRNLRFGLCTNGVNPFGDIGTYIAHGPSLYVSITFHSGFV
jgi:hypothetical protein